MTNRARLRKLVGVGGRSVFYEVPDSVNYFFDVPVLPVVGNNKGQWRWIDFKYNMCCDEGIDIYCYIKSTYNKMESIEI